MYISIYFLLRDENLIDQSIDEFADEAEQWGGREDRRRGKNGRMSFEDVCKNDDDRIDNADDDDDGDKNTGDYVAAIIRPFEGIGRDRSVYRFDGVAGTSAIAGAGY